MADAQTGAYNPNNPYSAQTTGQPGLDNSGTVANQNQTGQQPQPSTSAQPQQQAATTTPAQPNVTLDQLRQYYQQSLGRQAGYNANGTVDPEESDQQLLSWYGNMSPEQAASTIAGSQEARDYKNAQGSNTSGLTGAGQSADLVNTLLSRAGESLNINPTTDPIIAPQVNAYEAQQTRTARNLIDQQAESGNPYSTGAVQNARTQAAEQAGANTAQLQSTLAQNELTARRAEIQNALSESGSLLTADQQVSLQKELGLIDANLNQQGINSRNDQFLAQLGLQADNQNNYWDAIRSGQLTQ